MIKEWLIKGLEKPGKSQSGLARYIGIDPSAVNKAVKGTRQLSGLELIKAAEYLGEPVPGGRFKPHGKPIFFRGRVAASVWREQSADQDSPKVSQIPRDLRYPYAEQYALEVEGDSMNKVAKDGWTVVCVPYWEVRRSMIPGDLVHVERVNTAGQHEFTLKRLKMGDGGLELWPESTSKDHQKPIPAVNSDGYAVEIIGLVIGVYNPNP